ncbi:MAG: trigger factor [Actinobacteria bacterium]|nr:trigger factor [Actinomycetota bacterium]
MAEIKSTASKLDGDQFKVEVEVPAEEVKAQVDHTLKHMAADVRIAGFRKGKVPKPVLISHFGKETILSQTLRDALPGWYEKALAISGVEPIDSPDLDFGELEDQNQPYAFNATVQVAPRPKLSKYIGVEVEKEVVTVKESEVEEPIDRMRKRAARLETVTGRPAAAGDFVIIDFDGTVAGEPLEGGSAKDYMLEIGSNAFVPGFEEQIEGMESGQSKKLTLRFPENYQPGDLAGKEVEFDVNVKEIKERLLPELTDEFISENSEFDKVDELREDIRSRMTKAREAAAEGNFREQVLKTVAGEAEVDIPEVMIENRTGDLVKEMEAALQASGMTFDQYVEQTGVTRDVIMENFRHEAAEQVKEDLVLNAVAENEGIEVGDEEIEEEIRRQAERRKVDADKLIQQTRAAGRESFVKSNLRKRKALDLLAEKAIPVLQKQTAPSKDTKAEEPEIIKP